MSLCVLQLSPWQCDRESRLLAHSEFLGDTREFHPVRFVFSPALHAKIMIKVEGNLLFFIWLRKSSKKEVSARSLNPRS